MRFLIFSAAVGAALFYLMNDDKIVNVDIADLLDRDDAASAKVVDEAPKPAIKTRLVAKAAPQPGGTRARDLAPPPPALTNRTVAAPPIPHPAQMPTADDRRPAQPSPSSDNVVRERAKTAAPPIIMSAPQISASPAPHQKTVMVSAPVASTTVTEAQTPTFMSARERRRELFSLAEDMQLMSARNLGQ